MTDMKRNGNFHGMPVLIAVTLGLGLGGCEQAPVEAPAEVVRPAKLVQVAVSSKARKVNFPAIVNAETSSDLTFPVGGQIEKFMVREGDEVKRGQVIARLDPRNFQNELSAAQTQLDSTQSEFERAERLLAGEAIARTVFEQRQAALEVAQAQLDTARKALEDSVLRTPYDGIVAIKQAKELQVVQPSESIVTLQSTGAAEAVVQIPASLVVRSDHIRPISTVVMLDAAPDARIPATFKAANARADEATQTFEVKFSFVPPEGLRILPGMTGTVHSTLEFDDEVGLPEQVTVPLSAVLAEGDKQFVWLVDPQMMTVTRRDISVSEGVGEYLVVQSGLQAGDTVVGAGASYLYEGMKIRPYEGPE